MNLLHKLLFKKNGKYVSRILGTQQYIFNIVSPDASYVLVSGTNVNIVVLAPTGYENWKLK